MSEKTGGKFFEIHPDAKETMPNTPMAESGTVGKAWIPRAKVEKVFVDAKDPGGCLVVTVDGASLHLKCKPDDFVSWLKANPENN